MRKLIILALFSMTILSCGYTSETESIIEGMRWLNHADPNLDFVEAISDSDFRFMGVYGMAHIVPYVGISCFNINKNEDLLKNINFIKGTSDALKIMSIQS